MSIFVDKFYHNLWGKIIALRPPGSGGGGAHSAPALPLVWYRVEDAAVFVSKTNKTNSGYGHTRGGRICKNRHIWWFGVFVFVLKKKLKTNTCGGGKGTSWPGC
ncbi:MAG: hypothetical protein C0410_12080 [Anaerolinea sp.]|nr:hypothetical protein [Anaerolinea sp.]